MSVPKNELHSKTNSRVSGDQANALSAHACVLTGVGRSAIAVISLQGTDAESAIHSCFVGASNRPFREGKIRYGNWRGIDAKTRVSRGETDQTRVGESVVLLPIGDGNFEIHCHGGVAAINQIIDDLAKLGVTIAGENDSLHPQCSNGKPLVIREAEEVLSRCQTTRTAAIALDQSRGAMRDWCEAVLDGSKTVDNIRQEASKMLRFTDFTTQLDRPFNVVLAGRPNVGKSSLINAIVGYDRSITMDVAGTTRDVLHASTVIDGIPIRLSDTAGIRTDAGEIEQAGIEKAQQAIDSADLLLWISQPGEKHKIDGNGHGHMDGDVVKSLSVLNKADLLESSQSPADPSGKILLTVATTGRGIEELMAAIVSELVGESPDPGAAVAVNMRQRACLERIVESAGAESCTAAVSELLGEPDSERDSSIQDPS